VIELKLDIEQLEKEITMAETIIAEDFPTVIQS